VCRDLVRRFDAPEPPPAGNRRERIDLPYCADPFSFERRKADSVRIGPFRLGGEHPVRVVTPWPHLLQRDAGADILAFLEAQLKAPTTLEPEILEWEVGSGDDARRLGEAREALKSETSRLAFLVRPAGPAAPWKAATPFAHALVWTEPLPEGEVLAEAKIRSLTLIVEAAEPLVAAARAASAAKAGVPCAVTLTAPQSTPRLHDYRRLAALLAEAGAAVPILVTAPEWGRPEDQVLESAILTGGLLCDGLGDAVLVRSSLEPAKNLTLVYNLLQGSGTRITKTEYVSCPSCGRTLFDLQETTERIKRQTGHLKGVKIAIMGCIVNGPGEMADADFGYVGGAPDMINLYVGKDCVQKGIPTAQADGALIELIKAHGKWQEPKQ
ncbi:hypothetical protein EPO15_12655, partial [bacterium]